MKVNSMNEAWEIARRMVDNVALDEEASDRAGYKIYRQPEHFYNEICDLGDRLEINFEDGKSINIWVSNEPTATEDQMIRYLQSQLDDFLQERRKYGKEDRIVIKKCDAVIACKEMVESLIGKPINLHRDGIITIGF